ncbi:hypothetical protein GCM10017674_70690 [Streptomyces gardneri]|uniref:Uncharacterized protein n=1 Tax=Streptomyces gardneri TaxID=66892 RepID=A0A4Y3REL2_9ACTN|nr:hypothetical protein SGA01_14040 [Streptomyces gardneri]GHH18618.1 hypothetical protein GCM10017674_70690 [Streptomyces gardneri]
MVELAVQYQDDGAGVSARPGLQEETAASGPRGLTHHLAPAFLRRGRDELDVDAFRRRRPRPLSLPLPPARPRMRVGAAALERGAPG